MTRHRILRWFNSHPRAVAFATIMACAGWRNGDK